MEHDQQGRPLQSRRNDVPQCAHSVTRLQGNAAATSHPKAKKGTPAAPSSSSSSGSPLAAAAPRCQPLPAAADRFNAPAWPEPRPQPPPPAGPLPEPVVTTTAYFEQVSLRGRGRNPPIAACGLRARTHKSARTFAARTFPPARVPPPPTHTRPCAPSPPAPAVPFSPPPPPPVSSPLPPSHTKPPHVPTTRAGRAAAHTGLPAALPGAWQRRARPSAAAGRHQHRGGGAGVHGARHGGPQRAHTAAAAAAAGSRWGEARKRGAVRACVLAG